MLLHSVFMQDGMAKTACRDAKKSLPAKNDDFSTSHSSQLSCPNSGRQRSSPIMTCQIAVVVSDSRVTKAHALLDCESSTSFAWSM